MFNRFQQYLLWFFALRKWETNDIKLNKQIQISESLDKSDTVPSTDDLQLTTRKALGVTWDTKTDKLFSISRNCYECSKSSTH